MITIGNVIIGASYGNVSDIEIIWVLLAGFGVLFSSFNFKESNKDIKALRGAGIENGRLILAKGARFQDGCRAIVHSIFLAIGVSVLFLPESDLAGQSLPVVMITLLVRWGLIIGAAILVLQTFISYRIRRDIIREERHSLKSADAAAYIEKYAISKENAAEGLEGAAEAIRDTIP